MEAISKSTATSLKHLQRSATLDNEMPPPIPPLPLHYQRSDGKSHFSAAKYLLFKFYTYINSLADEENHVVDSRNELKRLRAMSKQSKQGELKR